MQRFNSFGKLFQTDVAKKEIYSVLTIAGSPWSLI